MIDLICKTAKVNQLADIHIQSTYNLGILGVIECYALYNLKIKYQTKF